MFRTSEHLRPVLSQTRNDGFAIYQESPENVETAIILLHPSVPKFLLQIWHGSYSHCILRMKYWRNGPQHGIASL